MKHLLHSTQFSIEDSTISNYVMCGGVDVGWMCDIYMYTHPTTLTHTHTTHAINISRCLNFKPY
jgi:hypothetical protein